MEAQLFHSSSDRAIGSHDLIKPASFSVRRVLGSGDLWITEYVVMTAYKEPVAHGVSIMKFRKIEDRGVFRNPFLKY